MANPHIKIVDSGLVVTVDGTGLKELIVDGVGTNVTLEHIPPEVIIRGLDDALRTDTNSGHGMFFLSGSQDTSLDASASAGGSTFVFEPPRQHLNVNSTIELSQAGLGKTSGNDTLIVAPNLSPGMGLPPIPDTLFVGNWQPSDHFIPQGHESMQTVASQLAAANGAPVSVTLPDGITVHFVDASPTHLG